MTDVRRMRRPQRVQRRRPRGAAVAAVAVLLAVLGAQPAQAAAVRTDMTDPSSFGGALGGATSNIALNLDSAFGMVSAGGVGSLLDSSFSMSDLDPVSGALLGNDVGSALTPDYAMAVDLSSSAIMAIDSSDLARQSLEQADAARKEKAAQDAKDAGGVDGQHDVGPDGCPSSAPANTLRAGSAALGIAELCANSVAQAPTAEAALAIKWQLSNLGKPYSQPNRMKDGWFDCSSLAMRSYAAAGLGVLGSANWAPNTAAIRGSRWAERISKEQTLPGDLVYPTPGHVATKLSDGYMVHTSTPGDVSHVAKMYNNLFYAVRVHPELV